MDLDEAFSVLKLAKLEWHLAVPVLMRKRPQVVDLEVGKIDQPPVELLLFKGVAFYLLLVLGWPGNSVRFFLAVMAVVDRVFIL